MTNRRLPAGSWLPVGRLPGIPAALCAEGAYLPRPLPSTLDFPVATYRRAADAMLLLGRLDEAATRSPVRSTLVRATRVRDARSSANLAGIVLGLTEAFAEELLVSQGEGPLPRTGHSRLVTPFLAAYRYGLDRVGAGEPVDDTMIGGVSAIMTGAPGPRRRTGVGWLGRKPERAYLLTASGAHLAASVEQWSTTAREISDQPVILKIGLLHYQLEVLQPFPTANGHVARTYSMLAMVESGLLRDQVLPLSVWLNDSLDEYQRQIRRVVDTGEVHHWLDFYTTAIRDQAYDQLGLIAALDGLIAEFRRLVSGDTVYAKVAEDLVGFPVTNHRAIQERYGVTRKFSTDVTRRLVDLGILSSWEGRGYRQVFVCDPVLDLLTLYPA
ncbi:hypothetical protein GCM10022243_68350 [Saccharothrix violaceirubra]|uniref:Fic family protein n=1 Tax=Saccharothrix violaceirubra TaxID=413306 RepID=A0A7W7T6I4_9PSEU|nr:hypothetical protein [Saccharothrix violaceirubra]MBB4967241.1 Fic family protein [Saccharothrix violaceirubra]